MALAALRRLHNLADRNFWRLLPIALSLNLLLALFIIRRVPYTEIDWVAYMQEVAGVVADNELDYLNLRGDTGPLVYPAGFVYVYAALYYATDRGQNIVRAQYIFAVLHTLLVGIVACVYRLCRQTGDVGLLVATAALVASRRVMSLFVLRMFNDGVQMILLYAAVALFATDRWSLGCFVWSLSLSVKMNALLFAPGLAMLLCQARGPAGALWRFLLLGAGPQIALGLPFLLHAPRSYLSKAFELTRVFEYKWSVNGAFLSEETFLDRRLSLFLLACHLISLIWFGHYRWTEPESLGLFGLIGFRRAKGKLTWRFGTSRRRLDPSHVAFVLLSANFVGIVFARTLHYQFYVWYAHALPLLVWRTRLPAPLKIAVPAIVELIFNVYPPTPLCAVALHIAHFSLLVALVALPRPESVGDAHDASQSRTERRVTGPG